MLLSEIPSIILREIILTIINYESIMDLKLTNKRLFNFINCDIVIQRYYLKLKYNLKINDNESFQKIKLLDSKFIFNRTFNEKECFLFANPTNDTFVFWNYNSEVRCSFLYFIFQRNTQKCIKCS